MKKIWNVSAFLLLFSALQAQQFQVVYDYNGFSNDGGAITKTNVGFLSTHAATDLTTNQKTTIVALFNEQGILQWDTTLSSTDSILGQAENSVSILPGDNEQEKWVIGGYVIPNSQPLNGIPFLKKFSLDGQILEEVFLTELTSDGPNPYRGFRRGSEMYLLCSMNNPNSPADLMIIQCNADGAYLDHYLFNATVGLFKPTCIVDVGDGFLVGGIRDEDPSGTEEDREQYILKVNYSGFGQWSNIIGFNDASADGPVNFVPLENGNYLFASNKRVTTGNSYSRPMLGELDASSGDTLWTKLYFDEGPCDPSNWIACNAVNQLMGFKKVSDGGYIGVGRCRADLIPDQAPVPLEEAAFMMKLDSQYNLLWKQMYIPEGYSELPGVEARCHLNDFVENEDGSLTALGRVFMYTGSGPQGGYIQDSYLIRVDSLGCLVSGCTVGIKEYEPFEDLLVYPNPTASITTIEFPHTGKWDVSLYNLQGALVYQKQFNHTQQQQIDLSFLPVGIYTLHCTQESNKHFVQRVVKTGD